MASTDGINAFSSGSGWPAKGAAAPNRATSTAETATADLLCRVRPQVHQPCNVRFLTRHYCDAYEKRHVRSTTSATQCPSRNLGEATLRDRVHRSFVRQPQGEGKMWFPALVFAFGPAKALGAGKIQEDAMNWHRGVLWLWSVSSVVWIAFMVGVLIWWLGLGAQWHLAIMASVAC